MSNLPSEDHFPSRLSCSVMLMLGSSLLALLCNQEASLVPPIVGAGSWISAVAAHLCRFLICQSCTTLPHEPHQSLVGNQRSYFSCRLPRTGCLNFCALLCTVSSYNFLCLTLCVSVSPMLLQCTSGCPIFTLCFFKCVCFSAHFVDIKAVFKP